MEGVKSWASAGVTLARAWPKTLLVSVGVLALALGFSAAAIDLPSRAAKRIERTFLEAEKALGLYEEPDVRPVAVRQIDTTLHHLIERTIDIGATDPGGAIVEYGDNIVFVEAKGRMGFVTYDGELHELDGRVSMNFDALLRWLDKSQASIQLNYFRVTDALLAREEGEDRLYLSYQRFDDTGSCVRLVVSSIGLRLESGRPALNGDGWHDVFATHSCVPLPPAVSTFEGIQAGGRLFQKVPGHLLLTTGDFGLDGHKGMRPAVAQDPNWQLGKILDIDIASGTARTISVGHRNPQGLTVDADGRIWETEHGPQGGDELNLIIDGRDYGWPHTTDGFDYGDPDTRMWPTNAVPGRHDPKFERPVYFFSPSIGISSLIQVEGGEFPHWKGDLLVGSLVRNALHRLRLQDGLVRSVEEISIGERVRDVILLSGGRVALYTDGGKIRILERRRPAGEAPPHSPLAADFSGYKALLAARHNDPMLGRDLPIEEQGRRLFAAHCASCHAVDGSPRPGPDIRGVQNRAVASLDGYSYSAALKAAGGSWDYGRLSEFMADPQKEVPGTAMTSTGLHVYDTHAVIAYLATLHAD